jgi:hypothetical protein
MKRSSADISTSNRQVRLLLHTVDGCVPYLTPSVLERYFPPSDDLWLGMAVRNTSVVPCFDPKPGKQKKERDSRDPMPKIDKKKPRGYTFDAVGPDPWLLPYTRLTVPSFDLLYDNETHQFQQGENSNSNKQVTIWTPHGRQKITPELYAKAASGLNSQFTLSLYDMNEDGTARRKEKAEARNLEWFSDLSERCSEKNLSGNLMSPILLPAKDEPIPPTLSKAHADSSHVSGVALVGRWRDGLNNLLDSLEYQHVAVLCTHSLAEVVEIASSGVVNIIGTDLPTRWAKSKHALGVDIQDNNGKRSKEGDDKNQSLNADGCMDMNDKQFARDTRPLVPGCSCLACNHNEFSRAYIHHLVRAKELLAQILLFGHNLHHLLVLVRTLNSSEDKQSVKDATISQLE